MRRQPFPLLALLFLLIGGSASAQYMMVQDTGSCNCMALKIDTTGISSTLFPNGPYPTGRIYAKQSWHVDLPSGAITLGAGVVDSVIDVSWTAIDTSMHALRDSFQLLEQASGGTLLLRKVYPQETSGALSQVFWVTFDVYMNTDTTETMLKTFPGVSAFFVGGWSIPSYVPNDKGLKPNTPIDQIQMASADNFWKAHFHKLGWHWNLYTMKMPMAWEITKGRPEIVIADRDCFIDKSVWGVNEPTTHPDLVLRSSADPTGNFIRIDGSSLGDGLVTTLPLGVDHGLGVLSCAVANGDNDNPSVSGEGMLGTCYGCSGLALQMDGDQTVYPNIDADGVANGSRRRIAVVNCSYTGSADNFQAIFDVGGIVVASAHNDVQHPFVSDPAASLSIPDINDPDKDFKVIAVGATDDGIMYDENCTRWYDPAGVSLVGSPMYKGAERFKRGYNYSPDTDKFNRNTSSTPVNGLWPRAAAKKNAFMDLVAPTGHLLYAIDGPSYCPSSSPPPDPYLCHSDDHDVPVPCSTATTWNARKYAPNGEGTSYASPEVAGICGLMVSVSRYLGVPGSATGLPTYGPDVQRKAYDILTFTADKIVDDGWAPTGYDAPTQPGYVDQTNDPLDRHWAQRMGFGRVNAYRAVAHSIRHKGAYSYSTSATLPFAADDGTANLNKADGYVNENSVMLMHFGAFKDGNNNANSSVLVDGGESIPGESYNNQGVTMVNGTGTTLTVPSSSLLAIDGKVMTTNATGNNAIVTSGSGKICITGYLEDVEVKGTTRVSDLIINSTGSTTTGCLATGGSSANSEIYGTVTLQNYGMLYPNQGTMTLKPGGAINMTGSKDVVIDNGAVVTMEFASGIFGNAGRKVVVKSGCSLVVDEGAKVEILCRVEVESGGTFLIKPKADVKLNEFYVYRGGAITLQEGSRLTLTKRLQNVCYGKFTSIGTTTDRVKINARVADCCKAVCDEVEDRASILVQDAQASAQPNNVTACYFRMMRTDVSNVPITTVDAPLYTISNNTFTANRQLFRTLINAQTLLTIRRSPTRPQGVATGTPNRDVTTISACTFKDEKMAIGGTRSAQTYSFVGLRTEFMRRATVTGCTFRYLQYGYAGKSNDLVTVTSSSVDTCNFGIYDFGSTMKVCSNTIHWTDFGVYYNASLTNKLYDNTIQLTRTAFTATNSGIQDIRNNTFDDYMQGLNLTGTIASLNPRQVVKLPAKAVANGRNTFTVAGVTNYTWGNQTTTSADIRMGNGGFASLNCGFNSMARNSKYHLFSTQMMNIPVGNNKFNDPSGNFIVRKNPNVTPLGMPLNTSATLSPVCDSIVTTNLCSAVVPGGGGGWCKDREYDFVNDGYWMDRVYTSSFLQQAYDSARFVMLTDTFDYPCRLVKARDAIQTAVIGDSTTYKLRVLTNDYRAIATSSTSPSELKSAVLMLKGMAHELLSEPDSAATAYSGITAGFTTSIDSMPAAWALHYLAASGSDTTYGEVYDSTMAGYYRRVLDDVRRFYDGDTVGFKPVTGRGESAEIAAGNTLEQNVPNPFGRETEIGFTLGAGGHVRLIVVDARGVLVGTLVDGQLKAGRHTVMMTTGDLAPGTYYYRLESGSGTLSRSMVITK